MLRNRRTALALAVAALISPAAFAADYAALPRERVADAVSRGATIVHDYGSFAWVVNSGQGASAAETFSLDLGGRLFDPLTDSQANTRSYEKGKALRLVQFTGPTRQEWLQSLAAQGLTPVQYIAPFSYVVWADDGALAEARRNSAVRWAGDFLPNYKTANVEDGRRRNEMAWRAMVYRGAHLGDDALRATGVLVGKRATIDKQFDIVELQGTAAAIDLVAQLPAVYAIDPVPRDGGLRGELANQITANNLNPSNLPVPGYVAWLSSVGVNGNGVTIANVDGGIFDTHPDLVARMLPCTGDTCGGSDTDAHGTHTAAIMAGDGSSGVNDAAGFRRGLGAAPGAKLVEQVYDPHFTQPGGMLKLMRQSHDNNAQLSGNSWGPAGTPRGYDADTRQVDVGTRDTKPDVTGDQPLIFVLSFMNGGGGTSTQGTPDEAKNTITIGSTKAQSSNGAVIPQFDDVSDNSGHGPALDGRRIPLLVTPGCSVDSANSATGYGTMCGTSMASPQVSGVVALFIEKYRAANSGATPSSALIKAALVAASNDLFGKNDADGNPLGHRPDSKQGWGRLRADRLLAGGVPVLYYDQDTRTFDATGETWTTSVSPADPTKPMQIVLAYTDAPGHGLGGTTAAWNNDLDLEAVSGSTTYRGNVFGSTGFSTSGGAADNKNNVESIVFDPAALASISTLMLKVAAANITSDALPNAGDATDQDFALVCVNCQSRPDYSVIASSTAESVCTTNATTASYGVNVGSLMGYTDPVNFTLANLPAGASGTVTPAAVTPPGSTSVGLTQLGSVAPGSYTFQLQSASTSGNKSQDLRLTTANATPAAAALTAPAANATNVAVRPTFTWAASAQAAEYVLEVATDAAFSNIVFTTTTSNTTATPNTDLATNTTHYWRVRPSNICGTGDNSTVNQFSTLAAPGDCGMGTTARTVFTDDVEGGTNGWTATAGSGSANWAISNARPYGGSGNAWLAQDPEVVSDQRLTSTTIALPAGENPVTLQFQSDQTLESRSGGCWDGGFIEVSTDGTTFTAVPGSAMLTDPLNGPLGNGNPAAPSPAWCGDPQAYLKSVVDLSAYAGQSVKIRFRMTSDTSVGRMPHGWYVDNIKVQSCQAAQVDAIFDDGFEP
ncbi:S8 family serine peptidase [Tahibacter amnicola]|uniref:S8 family serine peptidase n=1 Tax=Tahibacter amnicola TaxID=2976241 RepID=A0ABY6BN90_9GAMM|nr:S8 family serine peptidase [Tahibacter amnicola]UXI69850.1 S8 family serine peptidase [Tahibacter amnicola]